MVFDWADHYQRGDTPWDIGQAHPELAARLRDGRLAAPRPGARALVAGCGRGHDALLLARAGWRVTAIDSVGDLEGALAPELALAGGELVVADALRWSSEARFDLIFDHTFFCAIDPGQRGDFGALVRRQLARGGEFHSIVFPHGKAPAQGGPPYGMHAGDLGEALGAPFHLVADEPLEHPVDGRRWAERWVTFAGPVR